MKKSRVLAVVMAVLMMVTLLPSMVFATAVPSGTLDGKLKVKGTLAIGSTLSADYSKVKPEGITDDNVSFSWSLKDGDLLTEVGTDKTGRRNRYKRSGRKKAGNGSPSYPPA